MKLALAEAIGGALVILLIDWFTLRKANGITRLLAFLSVGLSACLWAYVMSASELFSPPRMIESLLKPLNPFH
jgi:uncharacterized membrane protein YqjE